MAWLGWTLAVTCGLATAYATFRTAAVRTESALQRENAELAKLEARSLKQTLEAERIIASRQTNDLLRASDPAQWAVATLSFSEPAGAASAVAVWNPVVRQGLLRAWNLPALPTGEEYRLWLTGPLLAVPVSAGAVQPDSDGSARLLIRPAAPIESATGVKLSKEKAGATEPSGPVVASGAW